MLSLLLYSNYLDLLRKPTLYFYYIHVPRHVFLASSLFFDSLLHCDATRKTPSPGIINLYVIRDSSRRPNTHENFYIVSPSRETYLTHTKTIETSEKRGNFREKQRTSTFPFVLSMSSFRGSYTTTSDFLTRATKSRSCAQSDADSANVLYHLERRNT